MNRTRPTTADRIEALVLAVLVGCYLVVHFVPAAPAHPQFRAAAMTGQFAPAGGSGLEPSGRASGIPFPARPETEASD